MQENREYCPNCRKIAHVNTQEAMEHLEQQVTEIQDVMYYSMTRVSGAADREATQASFINIQHTTNAHSNTNTNKVIADVSTKTQDQKQVIPDTLPHRRQDIIRSYTIWSTNDNQVDKQYDREYDNMHKQAEKDQNDRCRSEQRQILKAMTQDTPVKTIHNSAYIDNIIAYDKEVQRISKAVHCRPRSE